MQSLLEAVRPHYDQHQDPSHDYAHILRVHATCLAFGRALGADLEVLLAAACLHDVVNDADRLDGAA